jgi:uncharacterized protein
MTTVLLDCGPIVALLDRDDPLHAFVVARAGEIRARVITTGPVITEAMFLLQDAPGGPARLVRFLDDLRAEVAEVFDSVSLAAASQLMEKYSDIPMDFADASLVIAAARFGVGNILTLDERGFRTFRYGRNKAFRLVLQEQQEPGD